MRSLLAIKLDHIGDLALALPAFRQLISGKAHGELDLVVSPVNAGWGEVLPWVRHVHSIQFPGYQGGRERKSSKLRLLRDLANLTFNLRMRRYSAAIDFRTVTGDWRGKLICVLSGARTRIGGSGTGDWMLTHCAAECGVHQSDILRNRSEMLFPASNASLEPLTSIRRARTGGAKRIVLHPGAGFSAKMWPQDYWVGLRKLIPVNGCEVVWLGGEKERDLIQRVGARSGFRDETLISTSIKETLQVLADADLLLGLDSAAPHLAALVKTPAITIFSAANESARWRATGDNTVIEKEVECSPCHLRECRYEDHPCMEGIPPARVAEAIREKLRIAG